MPNTIFVKLHTLPQGWYLVWWRVISADGHPVRGAFTFAVGPSPGPPPQFVIPSLGESSATPSLVGSRWAAAARDARRRRAARVPRRVARPLQVRAAASAALRGVTSRGAIALAVALVATPVYLVLATAEFSLRPSTDLGAIVPLVRDSGFGRAFSDLWLALALLGVAAASPWHSTGPAALAARARRCSPCSARAGCAAAALRVPGPRRPSLDHEPGRPDAGARLGAPRRGVDLDRRARGPARALRGNATPARASPCSRSSSRASRAPPSPASPCCSPPASSRASCTCRRSASLWQTNYGLALIAKSVLLACALVLGGVNNLRSRPRLVAAAERRDRALGDGAARLLRRLVLGEVALLVGAVAAAAILTSLAPPSSALAKLGKADGKSGPVPSRGTFTRDGVRIQVGIQPNRAAIDNAFALRLQRAGKPVRNARVTAQLDMLDMSMQQQAYTLAEISPGVYQRRGPRS